MDQLADVAVTQEKQDHPQLYKRASHTHSDNDYSISINQLIAEPNKPSATQYFLTTLFQLSHYLFQKKSRNISSQKQLSFDEYLNSVSDQIITYDNMHKKAKLSSTKQFKMLAENAEQLLECYQRVPYAFFQQNFVLDFGQLTKNSIQIKKKQQRMNDDLDLVQINLFSQIHNKFHEYFKVVSNFQYLNQSLDANIKKNKESRMRINKVKTSFVQKASNLRMKINHKQNLQKSIKIIKIIKSLKKLPSIIKQILQSSLPYQCLSLLKSTKQSLAQVQDLLCLAKTSQTIRQSESLVQMGLNKRYADQLYLYLQECQNVNLQQTWDRINSNNCVDISGINNSMVGMSGILQQSILDMHPSASKNKRNEGKQFQISLILLQSYRFIEFPADLLRIKITNSLRIFCKRFDTELTQCLSKILEQKKQKILEETEQDKKQQNQQTISPTLKHNGSEQQSMLTGVVKQITVIFYVKHLYSFNEIMKDTLDRFIGYLHTLLLQFMQRKTKDEVKFCQLYRQQLSILPAITKVIIDKLKLLISLKNISEITFAEFKQWIGVLQYWKRYTDSLIDQNPLFNLEIENMQIEQSIDDALKKMISIFSIQSTISELVLNYITVYHARIINQELEPSFAEQTWQPIDIPSQFVDVLNDIAQWNDPHVHHNVSVTILNQSKDIKNTSINKSLSQDYGNINTNSKKGNKFRVLKSNVLVDGVRYKISVSLLLVCQFIEEYVKMGRNMASSSRFIYERMLDLIQQYNTRTKQLILLAKARQYQKMKSKNISAKHICLVHNCLSVLLKLLKEMNYPQLSGLVAITISNIQSHKNLLTAKLSQLLKSKVESTVASFLINKDQKVAQVNLNILGVFVQMMGAIDEYLDADDKKNIFKQSMDIFLGKYFKQLILKGAQNANQCKLLVEKMRFLRQYFPEQLTAMQKQVRTLPQPQLNIEPH